MTAVLEPAGQLRSETVDRTAEMLRVYQAEREGLVRRAVRFAGGRDQAEDAVQDAFVALLTNPAQVRNAAAYVQSHSRGWALQESTRRGRQVPVGDAMDWQPDTAPPAEDLDTLSACMGDPAVVAATRKALAKLPARQAAAIRMRMLERRSAAEVGAELGVDESTVRRDIRLGLDALRAMNVPLPEIESEPAPVTARRSSFPTIEELTATLDREHPGEWLGPDPAHETLRRVHGSCSAKRAALAQHAHNKPLTPPMRIRAGLGPESLAAANAELVATLDREFPGRTVTIAEAEQTLRRVHTTCSLGRARQARAEHNAKVAAPEGVQIWTPSAVSDVNGDISDHEVTAPIVCVTNNPPGPVVAEIWLMGAKPPISCLLVYTDETTGSRDLAAVSMPGAQREITGQLIADGYRPDGPWVDIDPAGPEAMRKFQVSQ